MKKQLKAILSTLLTLCLLYLAFTGALMYYGKTGMVFGIPRHTLRDSHFWVAFAICVLAITHLVINFRVYLAELRALLGAKARASRRDKNRKDRP